MPPASTTTPSIDLRSQRPPLYPSICKPGISTEQERTLEHRVCQPAPSACALAHLRQRFSGMCRMLLGHSASSGQEAHAVALTAYCPYSQGAHGECPGSALVVPIAHASAPTNLSVLASNTGRNPASGRQLSIDSAPGTHHKVWL